MTGQKEGIPLPQTLVLNRKQRALIEKTIAQMEAHPDNFDMYAWFDSEGERKTAKKAFACGATCCLAGHLVAATGAPLQYVYKNAHPKIGFKGHIGDVAAKLLGFRKSGGDFETQAAHIFHDSGWPEKIRDSYESASTPREKTQAGIARLRHLLETGN